MSKYLVASIAFGTALLASALAVVLVLENPNSKVFWVVRLIASLGAGFVSAGILGNLEIEGPIAEIGVKAGGPVAFTLLVYFFNPAETLVGIL